MIIATLTISEPTLLMLLRFKQNIDNYSIYDYADNDINNRVKL